MKISFRYEVRIIQLSAQINYSFSCLQCPTIYAQMDEKTGDAMEITEAIPLPALNVRICDTEYRYCC